MGGGGGCAGALQKPIPLRQAFHSVSSWSLRSLSVAGKASKNLRTAATLLGFSSQLPSFAPIKTSGEPLFYKHFTRIVYSLDKRYSNRDQEPRQSITPLISEMHLLKTTIKNYSKNPSQSGVHWLTPLLPRSKSTFNLFAVQQGANPISGVDPK